MTDFLLELRSEEIPARMQDKARDDLARLFAAELDKAGLKAASLTTYATPRRLALIAAGLPLETAAVSEEFKGPRTSAPEQALDGFLRKTGLSKDQLEDRDGVWFAVIDKPGRASADVLAEAIPAIIRAFPWPKSMRWGDASSSTEALRWVRPLQGIVALLGDEVVPCAIDGIVSGSATMGHRFHHKGPVTIGNSADYAMKLRAAHVIVDQDERRATIRDKAQALCAERGLTWIADEALVVENSGLTEWPVPLLGDFDPAFLEVPPEVIRLTLATNQKYFVCADAEGKLAPAFICTANIEAKDGGEAIIAGNRKVLAARLSDARFFWTQDKKTSLADHAKKLERITFHEKLGTVADKVERVAKLARWLVEEGIVGECPSRLREGLGVGLSDGSSLATSPPPAPPASGRGELADLAEQAARLCKADLVTEMVGEFPELQGVMGGYYARAEGLPDAVADAIRDHYKPVGQGDDVPTAPVTVAVSLADKLDTVTGFFGINEKPTGSKDPFALRRAVLGIIRVIIENGIRASLPDLLGRALQQHGIFWWTRLIAVARNVDLSIELRGQKFLDQTAEASGKLSNFSATRIEDVLSESMSSPEQLEKAAWDFAEIKQQEIIPFFGERLTVQQKEFGVRHDIISAVFVQAGEGDLVRLLARVKALQAFVGTEDGVNLLAGYKRAANILKKEGAPTDAATALTYTPEPAEAALIAALDAAEPRAAAAVAEERFEDAMAALATLRAPIDQFFDDVTVNDTDENKRAARLGLLARLTAAVNGIADFSKVEG